METSDKWWRLYDSWCQLFYGPYEQEVVDKVDGNRIYDGIDRRSAERALVIVGDMTFPRFSEQPG